MSDAKKEIVFADSMTIDKRNVDFAYLRKNLFPARCKGMYPARKFYQEQPDNLATTDDIVDVLGSEELTFDIKVIVESGADLKFYNLGSNSTSNTTLTGKSYECGAFGEDGVHICANDDHIWKVQHANSNTSDQGALLEARPDIAGYDGLYYWWVSPNEIYKQLGGDTPTVAFNNIGFTPDIVCFFGDQMVIMANEGSGITIVFWDKSDTDLFDQRISIPNARLVAGGVVNGRLMLVRTVGNSSNAKEREGEIIISAYDGEKFVRMNAIKAGQEDTEATSLPTSMDTGSEVMVFSVDDNDSSHNTDLYNNFIYKVQDDGSIEVQWLPDSAAYGDAVVVRLFYNFMLYATAGVSGVAPRIYLNEDTSSNFVDFEDFESTYITNFYCEPYNLHKLDGLLVAFEKLFEQTTADPTGEELNVYYRVSDRDSWTLLGTVTAQKVKENINARRDQSTEYASDDAVGLPEQRYVITKMPDGSALPEFNEIQFKFVSLRGFSIIGAWFSYSYLTRNTLP